MIARVILSASDPHGDLDDAWLLRLSEAIARARPEIPIATCRVGSDLLEIAFDAAHWRSPSADLFVFDELVHAAERSGAFTLRINVAEDRRAARDVLEILTRYQRLAPRMNACGTTLRFARTLEKHKEMHDLTKPLVRADYNHAIDTWQWALRRNPDASVAVQLAALFHDIERLVTEADERTEHRAPDYQAFKDAHAKTGAALTRLTLGSLGWDSDIVARTSTLIEKHERPLGDPELRLLSDADALSFFSLNSWGYLAYFGPAQTARKIAYSLRRMRPAARDEINRMRLHPEVARMTDEALAELSMGAPAALQERG
jgi:hypothetical protein